LLKVGLGEVPAAKTSPPWNLLQESTGMVAGTGPPGAACVPVAAVVKATLPPAWCGRPPATNAACRSNGNDVGILDGSVTPVLANVGMGAVPLTKAFGRSIGNDTETGTFEVWPSVFPAGAGPSATTGSEGGAEIWADDAPCVVVVVSAATVGASSVTVDLNVKARFAA
jgi:hypothetical protein